MADSNENTKVAVEFKEFPELLDALDKMVVEDDLDRSKMIRKLIRQEAARRQQLPLFSTTQAKSRKALTPNLSRRERVKAVEAA